MPEDPQQRPTPGGAERSAADVISPDEVAALLDGVRSGAVATDSGHAATGAVRPYDFAAGEHIVRGRLAALDLVDERFARGFRSSLERLLHRPVEIGCQGAQRQRFADSMATATGPTAIFVVNVKPFGCPGLLTFDAGLVGALTDAFYGGTGRDQRHAAGADFTPGEWRMARKCFDACVAELRSAWAAVAPVDVELVRVESNPQFAAIVGSSEPMLASRFRIGLESSGEVAFRLPMSALDGIRDQLQSGGSPRPARNCRQDIEAALRETVLELETVFSRAEITLGALMSLRAGDILEIERPDTVLVLADGQPIFNARYGISSGRNAVQAIGPVPRPPDARSSQQRRPA
jgi:flagellar motor switch protein FliM